MPKPDKKKKVVNQTGYNDPNVAPFTDNYQDLYRGMLLKHRLLYKKVEKISYFVEKLNFSVSTHLASTGRLKNFKVADFRSFFKISLKKLKILAMY